MIKKSMKLPTMLHAIESNIIIIFAFFNVLATNVISNTESITNFFNIEALGLEKENLFMVGGKSFLTIKVWPEIPLAKEYSCKLVFRQYPMTLDKFYKYSKDSTVFNIKDTGVLFDSLEVETVKSGGYSAVIVVQCDGLELRDFYPRGEYVFCTSAECVRDTKNSMKYYKVRKIIHEDGKISRTKLINENINLHK